MATYFKQFLHNSSDKYIIIMSNFICVIIFIKEVEKNMAKETSHRKTRSDIVVDKMIEIIKSGEFELDSRLPSETELSKRFGVSRSTLREAFKKLEQKGLVSIKQGSGTYLNDTNAEAIDEEGSINELIRKGFTLQKYQMTDYIDVRMMVELKALELAINKMDDQNYENLYINLQTCNTNKNLTLEEYIDLDCEFHREIIRSTKNAFLYQFWMMIEPCLREQQERLVGTDYDLRGSIEKHNRIYDALLRRNKKEAKEEMSEHIGLILGRFFTNITKSSKSGSK